MASSPPGCSTLLPEGLIFVRHVDQTAKLPGMRVEEKEWCEREDGDTDLGSPLEVGRGLQI